MNYGTLQVSVENHILTITINRPDKLNALNKQTISEIGEVINGAQSNDDIRVIIITGSGDKAFVAGADISEFNHYSESQGSELSVQGHNVFKNIEKSSKAVIAAINGFALGGGCELAMSCHIRIASENAKFGQPEVKLGLIPGYGGTQRLPMLIGKTKALELLITGDMISAEEAKALGLINLVTPAEQLMPVCIGMANKIAQLAPLAIAGIIRSVNSYYSRANEGFMTEVREFGKCFVTEDFKEGTEAFLSKRKAVFKGK
jgi:enoyl-CoA hydratase